jgi:hypothetical protein
MHTRRNSCALVSLTVLLGLSTACSTSLTNMSQARVLEPGELQAAMGYQFDVHTRTMSNLVDVGRSTAEQIKDSEETFTEENLYKVVDAALSWKLFPLGGSPEVIGRAGIFDGLLEGIDVGVRYNGNVIKGDVRLGLWESEDRRYALTAQAGYGHHRSVVSSWMEWVTMTEWKRRDLDFALAVGYEYPDIVKLYATPRLIVSSISAEPRLANWMSERLPERVQAYNPSEYFPDSRMYYIGANAGAMVGYKYLFLNFDLSVFRLQFKPEVFGNTRDYSGWVISPTLGVTAMWH